MHWGERKDQICKVVMSKKCFTQSYWAIEGAGGCEVKALSQSTLEKMWFFERCCCTNSCKGGGTWLAAWSGTQRVGRVSPSSTASQLTWFQTSLSKFPVNKLNKLGVWFNILQLHFPSSQSPRSSSSPHCWCSRHHLQPPRRPPPPPRCPVPPAADPPAHNIRLFIILQHQICGLVFQTPNE